MKYLFSLFVLLSIIIYYLFPSQSFAQTKPRNTITVLPQLTQLDLSFDKPEAEIFYTNNASFPVELGLTVEDVRELEDRNPVGILDPKDAANYKYSLSTWVTLSSQTLILNPGENKSIKVTINSEKLSPGGHYGTILAEIRGNNQNSKNVKVKGVLASLLFVRASSGNEIEEAKIPFFGSTQSGFVFPQSMFFRFQNTGNVDLTPYGTVEIINSNGKLIANGIVNENSLITLPEAIRKYDVPLKQVQKFILPGRYTATLSIHSGKFGKKLTAKTSFITIGTFGRAEYTLPLLLVILTIFLLLLRLFKRRKT